MNKMDDGEACALAMATTGCLDALDEFPAGAMEAWGRLPYFDQQRASRACCAEEIAARKALADQLINELLAEEKGTA